MERGATGGGRAEGGTAGAGSPGERLGHDRDAESGGHESLDRREVLALERHGELTPLSRSKSPTKGRKSNATGVVTISSSVSSPMSTCRRLASRRQGGTTSTRRSS